MPKELPVSSIKLSMKKPKFLTLYKFKSLKDLKYDMLDDSEDLIELVISRTDHNLIRYTKKKVYFIHPFFQQYACDIHGDIFDLVHANQPRIFPFQNEIIITHKLNDEEYPIKYKYNKFVSEALKIYKSDILKHNFEHDYEVAIGDEEDEACSQKEKK